MANPMKLGTLNFTHSNLSPPAEQDHEHSDVNVGRPDKAPKTGRTDKSQGG